MDSLLRRRMLLPKRYAELVALIAISSTLFLFLHTQSLTSRLREMEDKLQPSSLMSSSGLSGNSISQADSGIAAAAAVNQNSLQHLQPRPGESNLHQAYSMLKSNGQMQNLRALDVNNTARSQAPIVFFNRVPKVGSQTFMELLRRLAMRNEYTFHRDVVQRLEVIRLTPDRQQELAQMITELPMPSVYVKHVCYTNFTRFNMPMPIYVNMVRDPVERVISWYYYVRAPWYYVERKQAFPDLPLPDPRWLKKDFETCVLQGDPECTYAQNAVHEGIGDHRRQSLFFCGHEEECLPFNSQGALERAKYAVESQYAVVGVLEDLNTTLAVMERYIPKFFAGAADVYFNEVSVLQKINKNNFKPPVSEDIKNIVRRNFTREIEFYQFCKQRLYKQYLATQLPVN
ncbi:heparan sulfate 2-O-sulfotransferase pipe [Uranotaenia lowii]|uniref:heparan sulfate 2-O-sulfotransferase pipe n=1 Tax=Uranotaenia lowii TaxID=190385 RepID=UPI00247A4424|nr:heparan sulfate 2-O-sulfotransferase pipe [Uranotaenia lowii]XP_055609661.1 heparan sulfate 2-O-sulfotransferase pipe [Uranotaenia lowii]